MQFRIIVDAVFDDEVYHVVFAPKEGEEPEDAVERFDEWVEENLAFEKVEHKSQSM